MRTNSNAASNAVVHLVRAARLDEAERRRTRPAGHRFPDVHDGWDGSNACTSARGNKPTGGRWLSQGDRLIRQHPDDYDAAIAEQVRQARRQPIPVAT